MDSWTKDTHCLQSSKGYAPAPLVLFRVIHAPSSQTRSVPLSGTCWCPPLQRFANPDKPRMLVNNPVGFLQLAPYSHICHTIKATSFNLKRSWMGPNCHKVLDWGFSIEKYPPTLIMLRTAKTVNKANDIPSASFWRALARCLILWRAREKTVQGVPQCKYTILPSRIIWSKHLCVDFRSKLKCCPRPISTSGRLAMPADLMCEVSLAVPEKISRKKPFLSLWSAPRRKGKEDELLDVPPDSKSVISTWPSSGISKGLRFFSPFGWNHLEASSAALRSVGMCLNRHCNLPAIT